MNSKKNKVMISNPNKSQNRIRAIKLGSKSLILKNKGKYLGKRILSSLSLSYCNQYKKLATEKYYKHDSTNCTQVLSRIKFCT